MDKRDSPESSTMGCDSHKAFLESGSDSSSDYQKRKRTKDVVYVGLVLTALLISILSISLSIFNQMNISYSNSPGQVSPMCVACASLATSPPQFDGNDFDGITKEEGANGAQCCAYNTKQMETMIEMIVRRKLTEVKQKNTTHECPKQTNREQVINCTGVRHPVGAHIVLSGTPGAPPKKYANVEHHPVTGWSPDTNPAFLREVGFIADRLVIRTSGLYYIYSQISMIEYFDSDENEAWNQAPAKDNGIAHHVLRWNVLYPKEEALLRHSQSRTVNTDEAFVEYVSHVGGVFQLRRGDELYVSVSDLSLVQPDTTSSYFGLYLI